MEKKIRIVFMGTPEFAVASLSALFQTPHNIVAVVSTPDKPAGRGKKVRSSAVTLFAKEHNLPLLQPEKLNDPAFISTLMSYRADLFIVVAFRILPEVIWSMPPMGTFNLHASLLPHYRGAAPINRVIMNGEQQTGVTTFLLDKKIDTGKILLQKSVTIGSTESAGELHDRLMTLGAPLVVETVARLMEGNIEAKNQQTISTQPITYAKKIFKEECKINWECSSSAIFNHIRGLSPYPAAFTMLKNGDETKRVKLLNSSLSKEKSNAKEGTIITDNQTFIKVCCSDHLIIINIIQIEGKQKMDVLTFLKGFNFQEEAIFLN